MSTREAGSDLRGESKKQKTDGSESFSLKEKTVAALTRFRESLFDVSSPMENSRDLHWLMTVYSVHDGWGLSDNEKGNAIFHGETEHMDAIRDKHNFVELEAHGLAVGLKEGLMGNSEVG